MTSRKSLGDYSVTLLKGHEVGHGGMEFPVLWSGTTHYFLGAPLNSSCYIKKIVSCTIKQSGKKSPTKCCKVHLNIISI